MHYVLVRIIKCVSPHCNWSRIYYLHCSFCFFFSLTMCWVYCKILKLYLFWFLFFLSVTGTHTSSKNQQNINLNLHLGPQNCWRIFSWHDVWHWICTVTWFLLLFFLPFLLIYFLLLLLLQLFQDVFDPFWKFLWKMSFSTNTHNFFGMLGHNCCSAVNHGSFKIPVQLFGELCKLY